MSSDPTRVDRESANPTPPRSTWPTASLRVHRRVRQFEDAWKQGDRPSIREYLDGIVDSRDRQALIVALSAVEIEYRITTGEPATVEEYQARFPELANDPDAVREWVASELAARRRNGDLPDPVEIGRRFPGVDLELELGAPIEGLDDFEIQRTLGQGGMGVVYLAHHAALNRDVAIKVLHDAFANDAEALARFRGEARAIAQISDPGIVQIHAVGTRRRLNGVESPYLVLEYVPGGSLDQVLDGTPWPAERAARLVETVARSVQQAHAVGIVHRDLKPANLLLAEDGRPKVADFGLARQPARDDRPTGSAITVTGVILGTPGYMAPEQAEGLPASVGPAADVHALGAILYELLTGRRPYLGATPLETLDQIRNREPIPPAELQPNIPRDLGSITRKCLEKAPARRYPDAGALADDLGQFLRGEPTTARPPGLQSQWRRFGRTYPTIARGLIIAVGLAPILAIVLALANQFERVHRERTALQIDATARDGRDAILEGRWRDAQQALTTAIDAGHPESARLQVDRLRVYAALGHYVAIEDELARLRDIPRVEADRLLWEGDLLMGLDNQAATAKVREALARGLDRASDRWYARGLIAPTGEEAVRAFEIAIDEERFHPRARPTLIVTYLLLGRKEAARRSIEALGDQFNDEPGLLTARALLLASEGRADEAESLLQTNRAGSGLTGDPSIGTVVALVRLMERVNRALPALSEIGSGMSDASMAALRSVAGEIAVDLAQVEATGSTDHRPAVPAFLSSQLGWVLFLKDDPRKLSDPDLDRRIEKASRDQDGTSLYLLGMTAFARKRLDVAERALTASARLLSLLDTRRSALNAALNCQGWVLATDPSRAAETRARAVPLLRELLADGPPPAAWCYNLAHIARRSEQPVLAREIVAAWEQAGANPMDIRYLRSQIDFSDGKYARAISQARQVLDADPNHEGAQDLIRRALDLRRRETADLDSSPTPTRPPKPD